jgi:hypothetical protein
MKHKTYAKRIGGGIESVIISVIGNWRAVALLAYSSGVAIGIGIYMNGGWSSFLHIRIDHSNIFQSLKISSQSSADGGGYGQQPESDKCYRQEHVAMLLSLFLGNLGVISFMPTTGSWLSSSCSLLPTLGSGPSWL